MTDDGSNTLEQGDGKNKASQNRASGKKSGKDVYDAGTDSVETLRSDVNTSHDFSDNESVIEPKTSEKEVDNANTGQVFQDEEQNGKRRVWLVKLTLFIIVIVFLAMLSFMTYSYYRETIFLKNLSSVKQDNIVFYFPKEFKHNPYSDVYIDYRSQNLNQKGFYNSIRLFSFESLNKATKITDRETCRLFVEDKIDDEPKDANDAEDKGYILEKLEFNNFFGEKTCYFVIKYDLAKLVNDSTLEGQYVIAEGKVIVRGGTALGVFANYDDGTSVEERDRIHRSVIFFDVK
jgi:hypothetical protein